MNAEDVEALFTRDSGDFLFARWGRAIAPNVFGVDDATLGVIKGALEAVAGYAGVEVTQMDAELGSNLMMFFFSDWQELLEVPGMDRLVPELAPLVARLQETGANQYRFFRFDERGAIKACFAFVRMDDALRDVPAQTLALSQIVQALLLWSDRAFIDQSPLAVAKEVTVVRPDIAALMRAAYDPVLPVMAQDASHALRLHARMQKAVVQ